MTEGHSQHDAESKERIRADIKKYGCHLALLEPDNYLPGFAYTIGLFESFEHAEIICFGLNTAVLGAVLNHARDIVQSGERLVTNRPYPGFLEGYNIQFLTVEKTFYTDYVGYAGWFYNQTFDFPLLQLVWPDKQHKFPWEPGFNPNWKFKQPLLDRNADFKFYEERNLGVYTTKQAFDDEPILFVYHNEDGDWQFHTSEKPNLEDARFVCLEEITKLDPSINELYHLQYGWRAWRKSKDDSWKYESFQNEE